MISVQDIAPSITSIWLLHAKLLCERTASTMAHTFCDMAVAEIPIHSASALKEKLAS